MLILNKEYVNNGRQMNNVCLLWLNKESVNFVSDGVNVLDTH